jgi:hypothetical protein
MTDSPNTKPNSNSPNGGGDGGNRGSDKYFDEMIDRLRKGERFEIFTYDEQKPVEEHEEEKDTLNLRVSIGARSVAIRSGGWLILIANEKKVVAVRDGVGKKTYENACLVNRLKRLLLKLLVKYNVGINLHGWVRVALPREDKDVRRLQAWILATIHGTFNVLRDNPLQC